MIEAIRNKHKISIQYIEAKTGRPIDWDAVVEAGLEQVKSQIDRQRYLETHLSAAVSKLATQPKPVPRNVAIRDNIESVSTWNNLIEEINNRYQDLAPDLSSVKPPTTPPVANHKYYFESQCVEKATNGNYRVDKVGNIKAS